MAGAQRRVVTLRPPDYAFDARPTLARRGHARARALVLLNSPHNPTGKVFDDATSSTAIAELCVEHDLLAVTDEVYEHLVFDGEHVPLATLPGHARPHGHDLVGGQDVLVHRVEDRLGLRAAAARRPRCARRSSSSPTCNGAPFQHAVAAGLAAAPTSTSRGFAADLRGEARPARATASRDAGFEVFPPAGTYFVTADIRPLGETDGMAFCRSLPERCGVVAVPNVVFYDDVDAGATARALHVLQAPRGARRGRRAAEGAGA